MSRTKHHREQKKSKLGRDLWKPRPMAWHSRTTSNMKLERRLMRHAASQMTNQIARDGISGGAWMDEQFTDSGTMQKIRPGYNYDEEYLA